MGNSHDHEEGLSELDFLTMTGEPLSPEFGEWGKGFETPSRLRFPLSPVTDRKDIFSGGRPFYDVSEFSLEELKGVSSLDFGAKDNSRILRPEDVSDLLDPDDADQSSESRRVFRPGYVAAGAVDESALSLERPDLDATLRPPTSPINVCSLSGADADVVTDADLSLQVINLQEEGEGHVSEVVSPPPLGTQSAWPSGRAPSPVAATHVASSLRGGNQSGRQ